MLKITPVGEKAELGAVGIYRGVHLTIARMGNDRYKAAFRRLINPYKKEIENNTLDDDTSDEILCEALALGVLINWDAKTFPGNIEYSKENAKDLLLNDPDCRDFVTEYANDINNFLKDEEEEITKE